MESSERGDQELSFKLLLKSLASKFEKLLKFQNRSENRLKSAKIGGKSAKTPVNYGNFHKVCSIYTNYSVLHHPTKF